MATRVPRARVRGLCTSVLVMVGAGGGCVDFADPVIPEASSPAILQATIRVFDNGLLQIGGSLAPGRDSAGFQRPVPSPFIQVDDRVIPPNSLGAGGQRNYSMAFDIPANDTDGPFVFDAPTVRDVGTLPRITWHGLDRPGPDTIHAVRGGNIVLLVDTVAAASVPANRSRQWFLEVRGDFSTFRISADGSPPPVLRIPTEWVPPTPDGRAEILMIYYQTTQLRSVENMYIANVTLDVRLDWIVLFDEDP